jgi:alkanesulfonate monooxygenase SsuD/methylene tetrahydromethanopterin reductase-like flavin-dependent oxidoreductase (luciferase family)
VEFGIFIQGFLPGPQAHDSDKEHEELLREMELAVCADRNNWKFMWLSEHHALTEYSHLSANEVVAGYLAATTERIHIGSGIFNVSPRVNHPVRTAERVAMLDHLSKRRFEFGTGRGAGSHEVATFNIHDPSSTRSEWDEVIWEIVRMWERRDYTFHGKHFDLDTPHNILPKPHFPGHPPIWVACGNPATYKKAGSLGIGALGFTFDSIYRVAPRIAEYKEAIADCTNPVGQFVNDNVMITSGIRCSESRERAREQVSRLGAGYIGTLVALYHDSFPPSPLLGPRWPHPPRQLPADQIDLAISEGFLLCGTAEEICEQLAPFVDAGVDQLVFGTPNGVHHEEVLEMLEVVGQGVIPEFDKDPVVSTDRFRSQAKPKYGEWTVEPPPLETIWTRVEGGGGSGQP